MKRNDWKGFGEALPVLHRLQTLYTEVSLMLAANEAVRKIKTANADILDKPIPAAEPLPSAENLPIPAEEPKWQTEDLPRPAEGDAVDGFR